MFSGKKKKAKKTLDNAGEDGEAVLADAPAEEGDDFDFSSLKKKKKKRAIEDQVAALDAQLEEAGVVDEKEEGEDPFARGEDGAAGDVKGEEEAWLKSDRDYTYEEVISSSLLLIFFVAHLLAPSPCIPHSSRE